MVLMEEEWVWRRTIAVESFVLCKAEIKFLSAWFFSCDVLADAPQKCCKPRLPGVQAALCLEQSCLKWLSVSW